MFVVYDEKEQKIPIKIWLGDKSQVEPKCMEQALNCANLPFVFHHIALMPDTHVGFGVPIGSVVACKNVVVPGMVGVDIGCGMVFLQTNVKWADIKEAKTKDGQDIRQAILSTITRNIPVGFNHHKDVQEDWVPKGTNAFDILGTHVVNEEYESSLKQVGTLGGGNHFIELQVNEAGNVAIMIHSGSRNIGKKVCDYYNTVAKSLNRQWHSSVPEEYELAFLPLDSNEGQKYLQEMNLCLQFAEVSRHRMMEQAKNVFLNMIEKYAGITGTKFPLEINCHHNYASMENHCGENVLVHRKGAICARNGLQGVIPGSMGTPSYVVVGLGNVDSFMSSSHGSGRILGRNEAKRRYSTEVVIKTMKDLDIVVIKPNKEDIAEECPQAYKDIENVIKQESDLVTVLHKLTPIGVIKG